MKRGGDTTAPIAPESVVAGSAVEPVDALVALWAGDEPWRAGEVALLPGLDQEWTLGRGAVGGTCRVGFFRQGPGIFEPRGPLDSPALPREAVRFRRTEDGLRVTRAGRRRIFVNGVECEQAILVPGDTLYIEGQLLLLVTTRPPGPLPSLQFFPLTQRGLFGEADAYAIVGEHPLVWAMRELIAMMAKATEHVLIRGESGTGKELAATAIHLLSDRCRKPLVDRNAATFPHTLMDSELCGNPEDYPNVGTPERLGLYGEADRGMLFLDEIGDLPMDLQAKLLRTLATGSYQRLGDGRSRTTDFRLIGAMNRPLDALKHDLLGRILLRLEVPSLAERREDIPLLVRGLLLNIADDNSTIAGRFVSDGPAGGRVVRLHGPFVEQLVRGSYPTNVRGLAEVIWRAAITQKGGTTLRAPADLATDPGRRVADAPVGAEDGNQKTGSGRVAKLTREAVTAALERHRWLLDPASADLGLSSRFVLLRLMKELGIKGRRK